MAFREGANPYRLMRTGLETVPPCVSLHRYDRMGPRPLDFILVWGAARADPRHPCTAEILAHLAEGYERVFVSAPNGRAELYRRKPEVAEGKGDSASSPSQTTTSESAGPADSSRGVR